MSALEHFLRCISHACCLLLCLSAVHACLSAVHVCLLFAGTSLEPAAGSKRKNSLPTLTAERSSWPKISFGHHRHVMYQQFQQQSVLQQVCVCVQQVCVCAAGVCVCVHQCMCG